MYGTLKHNKLGKVLCDKCGEKLGSYPALPSHELYYFINAPSCRRGRIYLCFKCAREFSEIMSKERGE